MSNWVLIIDSGSGGEIVYSKIKKVFPSENYLLFIDKKYCPYGNKSYKELRSHITSVLEYFFCHFDIKAVVVACNTLSSMFKNYLKRKFKGTNFFFYEPFINKKILSAPTLVIATTNTIKYSKIVKKYSGNEFFFSVGFPSLAKMIDDASQDIQIFLKNNLSFFKDKRIQNIVLGCTHYEKIKPNLEKIFGKVTFYEKTPTILKNLSRILKNNKNIGTTLYIDEIIIDKKAKEIKKHKIIKNNL